MKRRIMALGTPQTKLHRVVSSTSGPLILAFANFAAAVQLQQLAAADKFGLYAFAQVAVGLGLGLSNALFGSPMVVALARRDESSHLIAGSFGLACWVVTACVATAVLSLLMIAGASPAEGGVFFGLAVLISVRWFLRALQLANGNTSAALRSDAANGLCLIVLVVALFFLAPVTLVTTALIQIVAAFIGIAALGSGVLPVIRKSFAAGPGRFLTAFRDHGRWALTGVITTEATSNIHAYLVTLFLGSAAFAPIAAISLYLRPAIVILAGLTQFERPRMATLITAGASSSLTDAVQFFRTTAIFAGAGNVALALVIVFFFPALINRADYSAGETQTAALIMSVVVLLRCLQAPESAVLQAAGEFRRLAYITLFSGPCTVALAAILLNLFQQSAAHTLVAIMVGEAAAAILIQRTYRRFKSDMRIHQ